MIFQNCPKIHSPDGSWNYVKQFWNITRGIYAKYHYKSCYYLYKIEDLSLYAHVVQTTVKQVISRRRKSENVYEMKKNKECTCKACKTIVFRCQICKFVGLLLPSSSWLLKLPIGHFGKYHNTLCLSPQILHKHCFQFLLGLTRENKNNAYAKFGETNEDYYGIFRTVLLARCLLIFMLICMQIVTHS